MRANPLFVNENVSFWANVRAIGESAGYSTRRRGGMPGAVRTFTVNEMIGALENVGRSSEQLGTAENPSELALKLKEYFDYRADVLNGPVKQNLMVLTEAQDAYEEVKRSVGATGRTALVNSNGIFAYEYLVGNSLVRVPMNKQKKEKRAEAYLTGMVNLLVAFSLDGRPCDYDPRSIPAIDHEGALYAALSRRMDGSFPSTTNPVAMWEVKEYYYTTSFGSKISDAVYITSLDGFERIELERATGIRIEHLLMIDARDTWYGKGRSYLCRMIDILHMDHVTEILFGREALDRLPEIVPQWVQVAQERQLNPSDGPTLDDQGAQTLPFV